MRSTLILNLCLTLTFVGCGSKAKKAAADAPKPTDPAAAAPTPADPSAGTTVINEFEDDGSKGKTTVNEPGAITGAKTTRGSVKGQVTASWHSVAGATTYQTILSATEACVGEAAGTSTKASSTSFTNVAEGTYYFCVRALDDGGQVLAKLATGVKVVADWTPPGEFTISAPSNLVPSRTPTVRWTVPEGEPKTYRVLVGRVDPFCADYIVKVNDLTANETLLSQLPDEGDYTVCVDAMDESGNASTAKSAFKVVPPKPILTFVGLTNGAYIPINSISAYHIIGTCTEAFRNVTIGGAVPTTVPCNGSHFFTADLDYHSLPDGNVTLTAQQTDEVGTISDLLTVTLVKDTVPPTASITGAPTGVVQAAVYNVTVAGAGVTMYRAFEGVGDLNCDQEALGAWTPVATVLTGSAPASGLHTLCILGQDAAGNIQTSPLKATWTVNQKPTLTYSAPAPSASVILGYSSTVTYAAADAEDVLDIDFFSVTSQGSCTDGSLTGAVSIKANQLKTNTTFTWQPAAVGTYYVCAREDDGVSGAVYKVSPALTVNPNIAPNLTFNNLATGAHPIVYKASYSIQYTLTDPDDDTGLSLYYKPSASTSCTDGTLSGWFPITTTRHKTDGSSYLWATTSLSFGSYYICAKLNDGTNTPVYKVSAGFIKIDDRPQFSFSSPGAGGASVDSNQSYTIAWTASDDDNAAISLYLALTPATACPHTTPINTSLTMSNTSYAFNTTSITANQSYYICAEVNDGVNPILTKWSRGRLAIKGPPPSITVTAPATAVTVGGNLGYALGFTATNNGSMNARVNFYSKGTDTANCSNKTLTGWTPFTTSTIGGAASLTYSAPNYGTPIYICGCVTDLGSGQMVCSPAAGSVQFNAPPTLSFTTSVAEVQKGQTFTSTIVPADLDDAGTTSYDIYSNASCTGTPDVAGRLASAGTYVYTFDTTNTPVGALRLCVKISDGINTPLNRILASVLVYDTTCVWTGTASTAWSNASNWTSCRGGAPTSNDFVDIPSGPANQPTTDATTVTVASIRGSGGGTITVRAGDTFRLGLSGVTTLSTVASSVTFQGNSTTCSTCALQGYGSINVENGATLTLGQGIAVTSAVAMRVGSTTGTQGHLIAAGGGSTNTYPSLAVASFSIAGPSTAARSTISIDGLKSGMALTFGANVEIKKFDRLQTTYSGIATTSGVDLGGCGGMLVTDTTWSGWSLGGVYPVEPGRTIANVNASSCSTAVTISGNGSGYGPPAEIDPSNVIAWSNSTPSTCVWTGATSSSWTTASNWSSCTNGRNNYPDQIDSISIPNGATNILQISGVQTAAAVAGSGGGQIKVSSGSYLYLTGAVTSDVHVSGATSSCTTCRLHAMSVKNGATLTIHGGVTVDSGTMFSVGDGSTEGHLKLLGDTLGTASTWPVMTPSLYWSGIYVEGPDAGHLSSLEIAGATIPNQTGIYAVLSLANYYRVVGLGSFQIDAQTADGASLVQIDHCSTADFAATTWPLLNFSQTVNDQAPGTHNINLQNCTTLDPAAITITPLNGGGPGYGDFFAGDTGGKLAW